MKINSLSRLFLSFCFVYVSFNLNAQTDFLKGYVLLNDNSKIEGYIDNNSTSSNAKYCYFKEGINDPVIKYDPEQISEYAINDFKRYVTKSINLNGNVRKVFLEFLLKGALDLFFIEHAGLDYYYVEKGGDLHELTNKELSVEVGGKRVIKESKSYVGALKYLMSDAKSSFVKGIESTTLNHKSLIKIAKKYHSQVCDSIVCIEYTRKVKKLNTNKWSINYGVVSELSLANNKLSLKINENDMFRHFVVDGVNTSGRWLEIIDSNSDLNFTSFTLIPGVFVNFNKNNNWTFNTGLKYNRIKNSSLELNELLIPLNVNYEFGRYKKLVPYLSAGLTIHSYFNLKVKEEIFNDIKFLEPNYRTSDQNDYTYTSVRLDFGIEDFFAANNEISYNLGLGVKNKLSNKILMKAEFNFDGRDVIDFRKKAFASRRYYTSLNGVIGMYYSF
jgi:hypothetical protein